MYLYSLCPGLYYKILPNKYQCHFCMLVMAICIFHQYCIIVEQLTLGHKLIIKFIEVQEEIFHMIKSKCYIQSKFGVFVLDIIFLIININQTDPVTNHRIPLKRHSRCGRLSRCIFLWDMPYQNLCTSCRNISSLLVEKFQLCNNCIEYFFSWLEEQEYKK